jgi:hypothetical protein
MGREGKKFSGTKDDSHPVKNGNQSFPLPLIMRALSPGNRGEERKQAVQCKFHPLSPKKVRGGGEK